MDQVDGGICGLGVSVFGSPQQVTSAVYLCFANEKQAL